MASGPKSFDVAVVGAGHSGAQCAISLRQQGFGGSIALIGAEPHLPYDRPSLSKDYLAGTRPFERMLLRPGTFWEERSIAIFSGCTVTEVLPAEHRILTAVGRTFTYGTLVWAAGGRARRLACPGAGLNGVHTIRSRSDVDALLDNLGEARRIAIVGGGYIGLEAAAVLAQTGREITLLHSTARLLSRSVGAPISEFLQAEHRSRGVDVRTRTKVTSIDGSGKAEKVRLADGSEISADVVIVGIGIEPAVEPLIAAGASGGDGVHIDEHCRTSLPGVLSIGDCAAHLNRYAGDRRVRLESIQNANDQAVTAARLIAGSPSPYSAIPWFWSNQYDLKLQTVGLSTDHDEQVVRGDPTSRSFSVAYLNEGAVIAFDCINSVKDFTQARLLVERGDRIDPQRLAKRDEPLKAMAA